jgi:hypothetical protein
VDEKFDWNEALGMNSDQSAGQRILNLVVTLLFISIVLAFVIWFFQGLNDEPVPTGGCDLITGFYCDEPEFP